MKTPIIDVDGIGLEETYKEGRDLSTFLPGHDDFEWILQDNAARTTIVREWMTQLDAGIIDKDIRGALRLNRQIERDLRGIRDNVWVLSLAAARERFGMALMAFLIPGSSEGVLS